MSRMSLAILVGVCLLASGPVEAARLRRFAPRQTMSFVPGDRSRPVQAARPHRAAAQANRPSRNRAARGRTRDNEESGAAAASPGAGFTMMDGVLTYPAPARFQPKALKHR